MTIYKWNLSGASVLHGFIVLKWCVLAGFVSALLPAWAAEKNIVAIHGFDKMSCADWFGSEENAAVRQQYVSWIRGIVTGYNFGNPDDQVELGHMPGDFALGIYVDNYCHGRSVTPTTSIAGAAFALIGERHGKSGVRVITEPPVVVKEKNANNDASANANSEDTDAFRNWVANQSEDMRSLDIEILRKIYKKEAALQTN